MHLTVTNAGNFPAKTSHVLTAEKQQLIYTLVRPDKSRAASAHNLLATHADAACGLTLAAAQSRGVQPQAFVMAIALLHVMMVCKHRIIRLRFKHTTCAIYLAFQKAQRSRVPAARSEVHDCVAVPVEHHGRHPPLSRSHQQFFERYACALSECGSPCALVVT